ncbi:hypothetical protein LR48_Vigan10g249200 [Vigna angularis]|uniref:Uncharacterized protein n=1 Tax=Phaseolus angularis TaxID=3914 RepID=A0A0L9VNG5_PHAAN|nr:hypothetical protein LR48_Vigan10g249200 [Vigna angularis]
MPHCADHHPYEINNPTSPQRRRQANLHDPPPLPQTPTTTTANATKPSYPNRKAAATNEHTSPSNRTVTRERLMASKLALPKPKQLLIFGLRQARATNEGRRFLKLGEGNPNYLLKSIAHIIECQEPSVNYFTTSLSKDQRPSVNAGR